MEPNFAGTFMGSVSQFRMYAEPLSPPQIQHNFRLLKDRFDLFDFWCPECEECFPSPTPTPSITVTPTPTPQPSQIPRRECELVIIGGVTSTCSLVVIGGVTSKCNLNAVGHINNNII